MADKEKAEKVNVKSSEMSPKNVAKEKKEISSEKKGEAKEKPIADDIRGIVRVAGKDVKGYIPLKKALTHIKGVGKRYAEVCGGIAAEKLNVDENIPIGKLSDAQLEEIEEIITNPLQSGLPSYLLNRRKEFTTGKDMHLISNDLEYAVKQDIEREMKYKSWRGISHMYRKKVRGQRTRTSGRKGGTVGVIRKKEMPKKAPAKKEEKK